VAAAQSLAPLLAASGDETERQRRLPPELVDAMADAGLFVMLVPRELGGKDADLATFAAAIEEIAKGDGSAGWCLSQGAGTARVAHFMEPEAARRVFLETQRPIIAWGAGAPGVARQVESGYRVTGRWSFASGAPHARWFGTMCHVHDRAGNLVRLANGSPDGRHFFFPAAQVEIVDTWHVSGLRGTGSQTYSVSDGFVPEGLHTRAADRSGPSTAPIAGISSSLTYATGFASVALGIARSALDAFVELAASKTPRAMSRTLRESPVVQAQMARAEAQLRSARGFLHERIQIVWEAARDDALTLEARALLRLATTNAFEQAVAVADFAYHAAGATAIFESQPYERRFRDIHAVAQQVQAREAHYETVGQVLLGLEPDRAYL
jgi:alkylation response protein AidB-like acyl-CoA dehydrogenase